MLRCVHVPSPAPQTPIASSSARHCRTLPSNPGPALAHPALEPKAERLPRLLAASSRLPPPLLLCCCSSAHRWQKEAAAADLCKVVCGGERSNDRESAVKHAHERDDPEGAGDRTGKCDREPGAVALHRESQGRPGVRVSAKRGAGGEAGGSSEQRSSSRRQQMPQHCERGVGRGREEGSTRSARCRKKPARPSERSRSPGCFCAAERTRGVRQAGGEQARLGKHGWVVVRGQRDAAAAMGRETRGGRQKGGRPLKEVLEERRVRDQLRVKPSQSKTALLSF